MSGRAVASWSSCWTTATPSSTTTPAVQVELREYCLPQPDGVTAFWVIDQLAWHALLLRIQLVEQADEDRHA